MRRHVGEITYAPTARAVVICLRTADHGAGAGGAVQEKAEGRGQHHAVQGEGREEGGGEEEDTRLQEGSQADAEEEEKSESGRGTTSTSVTTQGELKL